MRDMNAMRSDATRVARDVTRAARDAAEATRETVVHAAEGARQGALRVTERVTERAGHLATDAGAALHDVTDGAKGALGRTRSWIVSHPLHVLVGSIGAGYVLGLVLFRQLRSRDSEE